MRLFTLAFIATSALATIGNSLTAKGTVYQRIQVSENRHFLQHEDGKPFFYLGDTAWELFHRLNREEANLYLQDRAEKGFTVIQAVAIAELDGASTPNAYGFLPFENQNPDKPLVKTGDNNDYWDQVDYTVKRGNDLGLCIAMLPTWGRYWHDGNKPMFNVQNAERYGRWLAQRYQDANIIWILGGDRNPENENQKNIIRAFAKGLHEGDNGQHLITYHPGGSWGSADFFHQEDWIDFNLRQNGHDNNYFIYGKTLNDYQRTPTKPVMDGEPIYEDHPIAFQADKRGHSVSADCRRAMYWDLFNGACGHTYGHHSVWQMFEKDKRGPINNPLMNWREAIQQPGAKQMKYGKNLILSRPYFTRVPASEKILGASAIPTALPGQGNYRFVATGDEEGTYLMVYAPIGRKFTVNTSYIKGKSLKAWWYNPRDGKATLIGTFENRATREFISPTPGELSDWILVIDDASKRYGKPGVPIYK